MINSTESSNRANIDNTANTANFFQPSFDSQNIVKPYALMDLDDTLFQTQRKIDAWALPTSDTPQLVCASVNKQGEPLSFMTGRQQILFNWLLNSTELILVTARDTQEIKRVKLPFNSWQVLTHGAVILQPDATVLKAWQAQMYKALQPLQDKISKLVDIVDVYNKRHGNLLKLAVHSDEFQAESNNANGNQSSNAQGSGFLGVNAQDANAKSTIEDQKNERLQIYLAVKHTQKDHQALQDFAHWLAHSMATEQPELSNAFYIHSNANNLAILPHAVHKKHAVAFLLDHYLDSSRPSFGFGDSLADLPFLQLLDWYGTPNHGQLHDTFTK